MEHDGDLVVGGDFSVNNGLDRNLACFDGDHWHGLGDLGDRHVHGLGTYHGDLIAGGCFTTIDGAPFPYVARHDGEVWRDLDGGTDGTVQAIAEFGDALFVGGGFSRAGRQAAANVACWVEPDPTAVSSGDPLPAPPVALRLDPASPNPFNPRTVLRYELPHAGAVHLAVVDLRGRHVRTLVSGYQAAGRHRIGWDGLDDAGRPVASGTYVVRLDDGRERQARKLTLAR
jgi:hypothetical protein